MRFSGARSMIRLAAVAGSISSTSSISQCFEQVVQLLDVGVLEAELGRGGRNLGVRDHADLQPASDQRLDLFQLLKFRC